MNKPCPFCGSNEYLGIGRGKKGLDGYPTFVYCTKCRAQGPKIYTTDKGIWTSTFLACEKTGWNNRETKNEED
jgi:hypothetical protein